MRCFDHMFSCCHFYFYFHFFFVWDSVNLSRIFRQTNRIFLISIRTNSCILHVSIHVRIWSIDWYVDWYHQLSVGITRNEKEHKQTNSLSFYVRECFLFSLSMWMNSFLCAINAFLHHTNIHASIHVIDVYEFLVADEKLSCAFVDTIWTFYSSIYLIQYGTVHANDFNLHEIYFELISIINFKWLMWHSAAVINEPFMVDFMKFVHNVYYT